MNIAKFDIFSSHFLFNIQSTDRRKATTTGFILTLATVIIVSTYFIYLSYQYFNNQIDPKYRSQSFSSSSVDLPLIQDLIAFRFEYDLYKNINQLEQKNNKTYLNHYALFRYQNKSEENVTVLNLYSCQNPLLKGYTCIDTSKISDQLLVLNNNENILSQIIILTFACYSDYFQQQASPNCANKTELNNVIGMWKSKLHIKLLTSQYNITSMQNQINYIDKYLFLSTQQSQLTYLTAQKQLTTVHQGVFFQSLAEYSTLDDDDDLNEKNANQDRGNVFVRQILTKSKDQIDKKMSLIPHQLDLNSYLDEKKECNTEETPKSIFYTKQITQSQNIAKEEKKQKISKQIWKQNHFNNEKAKKNIENDTLSTKQNEIAMTFSQSIKTEIPLITDQCFNHLKSGNSQLPYEKKLKSEEYQAERLKVFLSIPKTQE
ncbi:hypothetical protein ABPG74_004264 [Tetrahymena malaccensis]